MNTAAIRKICMSARGFVIMRDAQAREWIGDGMSFYYAEALRLDENIIRTIFNITETDAAKAHIRAIDAQDWRVSLERMQDTEVPLDEVGQVIWAASTFRVLHSVETGVLFVREDYLKPAYNKDKVSEFYARISDGLCQIIAVYNDMFPCALILPETTSRANEIHEYIKKIAAMEFKADKRAESEATDTTRQTDYALSCEE